MPWLPVDDHPMEQRISRPCWSKNLSAIMFLKWFYISALLLLSMVKILFPFQGKGFFPGWFGVAAAAFECAAALTLATRFRRFGAFLLVLFFLSAGAFSLVNPETKCGCFGSIQVGKTFHGTAISLLGIGALLLFLSSHPQAKKRNRPPLKTAHENR